MGNHLLTLPPVPAPSLRELKKRTTSEVLAAAAYDLVREVGPDVTLDEIAGRAGYSRRTFANHFACKQEAVVEGFFHRIGLADPTADLAGDTPATSLAEVIDLAEGVVGRILTPPALTEVRAFGEILARTESLRPFLLDGIQRLRTTGRFARLTDHLPQESLAFLFGATVGMVATVLERVMGCEPDAAPPTEPDLTEMSALLTRAFDHLRHGFAEPA